LGDFSHTLLVLKSVFRKVMCHYIGFPFSCESIIKVWRYLYCSHGWRSQLLLYIVYSTAHNPQLYGNDRPMVDSIYGLRECVNMSSWVSNGLVRVSTLDLLVCSTIYCWHTWDDHTKTEKSVISERHFVLSPSLVTQYQIHSLKQSIILVIRRSRALLKQVFSHQCIRQHHRPITNGLFN